jgi:hypothetical protein
MSFTKRFSQTLAVIALSALSARTAPIYTAHEWGTFTSVQGGDSELLPWRPLQTSELPGFVYNWSKPGMNRNSMFIMKGQMVTLQRMETPVIYFYTPESMSVDVNVAFPKGSITEWYPQATQIGPSAPANTNTTSGALPESRAIWKNLKLVPSPKLQGSSDYNPPEDNSGSHYFAARATGASVVREDFTDQTNAVTENEKFIFYRGVGNFKTPLRVSVDARDTVVITNEGPEELPNLFLINIHKETTSGGTNEEIVGEITSAKSLARGHSIQWPMLGRVIQNNSRYPLAEFQRAISAKMETALVSEGLFPDEAKAMVNTWKDSWFTEEGVRVLYILPRSWTDETLPMTLNPQPKELTRVMVGRAEIITPQAAQNLQNALATANEGDADARKQALVELKKFGRFAEPALQLAGDHGSKTNLLTLGYQLLYPSQSSFE